MKIDTQIVLKDMKGENLKIEKEDYTLGKALANILLADESGGKMKLYVLARKFAEAKGKVEIDSADLALVKRAAEQTKNFTPLLAGQALVLLDAVKEV